MNNAILRDECTDIINESRKWNFTMKNRLNMQNFEQKLSFFSLFSKIYMGHVTNFQSTSYANMYLW